MHSVYNNTSLRVKSNSYILKTVYDEFIFNCLFDLRYIIITSCKKMILRKLCTMSSSVRLKYLC